MSRIGHVDFPALALKGIIEQDDPAAYFGSLGALREYLRVADARGWLRDGLPTEEGQRVYESSGLADLPRTGRGYLWDWSGVRIPAGGGEPDRG